jgi:hypothetical protein
MIAPEHEWQPTAVEVAAVVDEMRPIIRAFAARAAREVALAGHRCGGASPAAQSAACPR